MKPIGFLLICVLLIAMFSLPVSATTCSFINITTGPPGANGADGAAATCTAGSTTTLPPGSSATVVNSGTPANAIFDFGIPAGYNGTDGAPGVNGTAATVAINYTFTLSPGSPATATNVGDSTHASFDFGIPAGATGPTGPAGSIPDVSQFLFINGTRAMTGNLSMGTYNINNLATPSLATDAATKGYVDSVNASLSTGAITGTIPVALTFTRYAIGGPLGIFLQNDLGNTINAISTNVTLPDTNYSISTSGAVKAYVDSHSSNYNASYWTGTNYNASYWTGTNYNASYLTSTYNVTYDNKANATQYSYMTLMAGSAMIPTTNPPLDFNQRETSTNKNQYIYANFSVAGRGTENVQWIVDMPADWNGGNITANFLWTAYSGTGDVNWTLSGMRFPDNTAIDTALPLIGYSVDTLQTAYYMHVSPYTTAATPTSAGTGGQTMILKVIRSSTSDTFTTTAELIGVRIKYISTKVAA